MDKVLTAIVELMTALVADSSSPLYFTDVTTTPHGVRSVFLGDPNQIPADDFPTVIVRPVNTVIEKEATKYDQKTHTVEVVIVDNLRNYSESSPTDPRKVQSLATMMSMMEGTNTSQGTSGKSIAGKILANPKLPYTSGGTKYAAIATHLESIDYVFNTSRGFPTFEVIAQFRVISQGDRA